MTKKKIPTPLKKVETKTETYVFKHPTKEEQFQKLNDEVIYLQDNLKQYEMPQGIKTAAQPSNTILDSLLGDMDKHLSRFYNAMNTLDSFADRLKPSDQAQMPIGPAPLPPSNIIGRMERLISDFNHLNNRLEATNNYLSEIV